MIDQPSTCHIPPFFLLLSTLIPTFRYRLSCLIPPLFRDVVCLVSPVLHNMQCGIPPLSLLVIGMLPPALKIAFQGLRFGLSSMRRGIPPFVQMLSQSLQVAGTVVLPCLFGLERRI